MKTIQQIKEEYIKLYPALARIRYGSETTINRVFAQNALNLKAPCTVTAQEVLELSKWLNKKG